MTLPELDTPENERIDKNVNKNSLRISDMMFSVDNTLLSILNVLSEQLEIMKKDTSKNRLSETQERVKRSKELEERREQARKEKNQQIETRRKGVGVGAGIMNILDIFGRRFLTSARLLGTLGVIGLLNNWEQVSEFFTVIVEQVKKLVPVVKNIAGNVLPLLIENLNVVLLSLLGLFAARKFVQLVTFLSRAKTALASLSLAMSTFAVGLTVIGAGLFAIVEAVKAFNEGGGGLNGIREAVISFAAAFIGAVPDAITKVASWIAEMLGFENLSNTLQNINFTETIADAIRGLGTFINDMIFNSDKREAFLISLGKSINNFWEKLTNVFSDMFNRIIRPIRSLMFGKTTENVIQRAESPQEEHEIKVRRLQEEIRLKERELENTQSPNAKRRIFQSIIETQNELADVIKSRRDRLNQIEAARLALPAFENFAQGVPARSSSGGVTGFNVAQRSQEVVNNQATVQNIIAPATQVTDARTSTSISNQNFVGSSPLRSRKSPQQRDFVRD